MVAACRPPIPPLGCLFSFFLFTNHACRPPIPPLGCLFSFFHFLSLPRPSHSRLARIQMASTNGSALDLINCVIRAPRGLSVELYPVSSHTQTAACGPWVPSSQPPSRLRLPFRFPCSSILGQVAGVVREVVTLVSSVRRAPVPGAH